MPSMSEDALFKALLKNKPQQKTPSEQNTEAPARNVPRSPGAASSEDAMYKALLKNRPQQQSAPLAQKTPMKTEVKPAPPMVTVYEEPAVSAVITPTAVQADQVAESIKNLNASVNIVQGLLKTAIIVLVLILIVGLANLIKG